MIAVVLAVFMLASDAPPNDPTDWKCAEPLIQKNYRQRVSAQQLALRIADKCARPFAPPPPPSPGGLDLQTQERTIYGYSLQIFIFDIEARIQQARRQDAIPLNR